MIYVRGAGSAIAQALAELEAICPIRRLEDTPDDGAKYLFCAGSLIQKKALDQDGYEIADTFSVNASSVIRSCDRLIEDNPKARICVIGSEAAYTGSFNAIYAASKAALHRYVETKRLKHPGQQLVCVAPSIIANTGMTEARNAAGKQAMEDRRLLHPKGRFLEPMEVARMVHFLLSIDQGYTTGTVIRMNGGEHTGAA